MRKIKYIIICYFLTLCSCEYDVKEDYFIEKEEPMPNKEIDINLYGVRDDNVIYIYDKTWLNYSINEEYDKILKKEITLDGVPLEDEFNRILIEPEKYDNSIHKLKLYVESMSGTGSIADKFGLERYIGEKEYTLKYVHVDRRLTITDGLSDENYLKLQWEKPNIEGIEIDRYEIIYDKDWSFGSRTTTIIKDPNITYLIDKNYVHSYKDYEIRTFFKDNKIEPWSDRYTMNYNPLGGTKPKIEIVDLENAQVTWEPNKYRCSYNFDYDLNDEFGRIKKKLDYSISKQDVHLMAFPNRSWGVLNVLPQNYDERYSEWGRVEFIQDYSNLVNDYGHSKYTFDIQRNRLYGLRMSYAIIQFDLTSMKKLGEAVVDHLNYFNDDKISCSSQTGKVAALDCLNTSVYIYDENLKQLDKFNIKQNIIYTSKDDIFSITDDNLIVVSGIGTYRELQVYSIKGEFLYDIPVPLSPYKTKITTSANGKYICIYNTYNNIKIYELGVHGASLYRDIDISDISGCYFDLSIHNELIVQKSNNFYMLNIETLNETEAIKGIYIAKDPYTGRILYSDLDYKTNKLGYIRKSFIDNKINKIKLESYYSGGLIGNIHFINNFLFTDNPYWDISKYLK